MDASQSVIQDRGLQKASIPSFRGNTGLFASCVMRVVCAWCQCVMQEGSGGLSHSCYPACRERYFKKGKDR